MCIKWCIIDSIRHSREDIHAYLRCRMHYIYCRTHRLLYSRTGEIHRRSREPGPGGQCASISASPLEPRIAPSSAQRPERAHTSDPLASLSHVCRSPLVFIIYRRRFSRVAICTLSRPMETSWVALVHSELRCRRVRMRACTCTGCCACVLEV
jgi:hypothetical protein